MIHAITSTRRRLPRQPENRAPRRRRLERYRRRRRRRRRIAHERRHPASGGFPSPPILRGVVLKLRELQPEMVLSPRTVWRATAPGAPRVRAQARAGRRRAHRRRGAPRGAADAALGGAAPPSCTRAQRALLARVPPGAKSRSAGRKGVTKGELREGVARAGEEAAGETRSKQPTANPRLLCERFCDRDAFRSHERPRLEKQQRVVMRGYALPCSQMLFSCLIT